MGYESRRALGFAILRLGWLLLPARECEYSFWREHELQVCDRAMRFYVRELKKQAVLFVSCNCNCLANAKR
jgi:hypothetical protein